MKSKIQFSFLLITTLLLFSIHSFSQSTIGKKIMSFPRDYEYPNERVSTEAVLEKKIATTSNVWIVFADRENAQTYVDANKISALKKLKFMDAFYVIDENDKMIHIVKYEPVAYTAVKSEIKIKSELEDYGWVEKNQMLLWQSCLTTFERYSIKGLAINSVSTIKDIEKNAKQLSENKLPLFSDPKLSIKTDNDFRLFEFLYIYKKEGNACLVGKVSEVRIMNQVKNASKYILGWVPAETIKEWKQRLCLEPNPSAAAVEEMTKLNLQTGVFLSEKTSSDFAANCTIGTSDIFGAKAPSAQRESPYWKRYPILDDNIDKIKENIRTGTVTNIMDKNGNTIIKSEEYANVEKEYNQLKEKYNHVNVVFVVDGSEKLMDYKSTIASSIRAIINKFNVENEKAKQEERKSSVYKMGLVVYRNYDEKNCSDGDKSIYSKPLTSNYEDVLKTFDEEIIMGRCHTSNDYMAMYSGINEATKMFDEKDHESNLVILIGCAANDPADKKITQQQVIEQLAKYKVGLLAFQVKNTYGPEYKIFDKEIMALAGESSNLVEKEYSRLKKDDAKGATTQRRMGIGQYDNSFQFDCPKKDPLPGVLMFSDLYNSIDNKKLSGYISNSVDQILTSKTELANNMESYMKGQGKKIPMNAGMYSFLNSLSVNVETLQKVSYDNLQLYIDGYIRMKCAKSTTDLYAYNILVSDMELSDLIYRLNSISKASQTEKETRESMKAALLEIVATYMGKKEAQAAMNSTKISDLLKMVVGMPCKSSILKKYTISDITDIKKFDTDQFMQAKAELENCSSKLEEFRKDEKNKFTSSDQGFYWIPQELLP